MNAAYAARACTNFPALVKALQDALNANPQGKQGAIMRAVLAEALKD